MLIVRVQESQGCLLLDSDFGYIQGGEWRDLQSPRLWPLRV